MTVGLAMAGNLVSTHPETPQYIHCIIIKRFAARYRPVVGRIFGLLCLCLRRSKHLSRHGLVESLLSFTSLTRVYSLQITGWFNLLGQIAVTASIKFVLFSGDQRVPLMNFNSFSCATFLAATISLGSDFVPNARSTIGIYAAILVSQGKRLAARCFSNSDQLYFTTRFDKYVW